MPYRSRLVKMLALISALILMTVLCCPAASASSRASGLKGTWYCTYGYSLYWNERITDDEYYTFWNISGNRGNYKYENRTAGFTMTGVFTLGDDNMISFVTDISEDIYEFYWDPDDNMFTLTAEDIYIGHFELQ